MIHRVRGNRWVRRAAVALAMVMVWLSGPGALAGYARAQAGPGASPRPRPEARLLEEHELRAITGRQMPGDPGDFLTVEMDGPPRPWVFSHPDLGGYGQIASGNQHIAIPLTAHGGRGLSFSLHYSSQAVETGSGPWAPISNGWSHTFTTRVVAGFQEATVVYGDGRQDTFTENLDGSYTAPAGVYDTLVENQDGTYTLTHKSGVAEGFTSAGKLVSQVDRNGNTLSVSYYTSGNGNGQVHQITDSAGRSLTLAYNSTGLLSTVTDGAGREFSLSYNGSHFLTQVTLPAPGAGQSQPYYALTTASNGMVTGFQDRRGATWTIAYDSQNAAWPVSVTDHYNHTLSIIYSTGTVTRENGATLSWTADSNGNMTSVTLPADAYHGAQTTTYTWDSQHNMLTRATGGSSYTWYTTYDSRGNVLTVEDPVTYQDGQVVKETFTYNSLDLPTSRVDALGNETTFTYDSNGNLLTVTDPLEAVTSYTYDSTGQCTQKVDARGKTWTTTYDSAGNVTGQTNPLSGSTTLTYSSTGAVLGLPASVTSPGGIVESFTYDNLGRRTRVTHGDNTYADTSYDAEGAVVSVTDENGKSTSTSRNLLGYVTSVTDPNNHTTSFTFDYCGQRTALTNARGKTTGFTLDNGGRAVRTDFPDGTYETAAYNSRGLLASTTDGRGYTVSYSYDTVGRRTGIDYPTGTDTSWSYRNDDRPDEMTDRTGTYDWTYNARGETVSLSQPQGTVSYTYAATGQRASVARSGLSGTISYSYDDAGRCTSLTNQFSETTSFTLDADGRVTQQTHANGTKVLTSYDSNRGWVTGIEHRKSDNSLLAGYTYTRDSAGILTSESQGSTFTVSYTYDNAYQLVREARTGTAAYDYQYTYDAVGNRLTKNDGTNTENYTYDDADKLLAAGSKEYSYDAAGNLTAVTVGQNTTSLTWDYAGRLSAITYPNSSTNSFTYNDLGQRTSKTDSAGTVTSLFDGSRVLADSRADYTIGGVTGLISERASGTTLTYHGDQLASTRGLTDSSQAPVTSRERDAWGNVIASSGTLAGPFGFVGGEGYQQDADSGLMLLGARYYDPSVGRFISPDPLRYGSGDPNHYRYSANCPPNGTDPSGCFVVNPVTLTATANAQAVPAVVGTGGGVVGALVVVGIVAIGLVTANIGMLIETSELNQRTSETDARTREMEEQLNSGHDESPTPEPAGGGAGARVPPGRIGIRKPPAPPFEDATGERHSVIRQFPDGSTYQTFVYGEDGSLIGRIDHGSWGGRLDHEFPHYHEAIKEGGWYRWGPAEDGLPPWY